MNYMTDGIYVVRKLILEKEGYRNEKNNCYRM